MLYTVARPRPVPLPGSLVVKNGSNFGSELRVQLDILTDEPAQHPLQISDNGVEVEDLRLEHLLPTEDEELPSQPGGSFGGFFDFLNVEARAGIHAAILEQEPAGTENRGQQVIEVVRDPASQSPHRFHLLRLAVLDFETTHLCQI